MTDLGFKGTDGIDFGSKYVSLDYAAQYISNLPGASYNTLWTWGYNGYGGLADGGTTARSSPGTTAGGGTTWSQITGANYSAAAIKTDGTLWTWGANDYGVLGDGTTTNRSSPGTVAGGGTTWKYIDAGSYHFVGVKTDGTLWTWGRNALGNLGDGTTTNRSSPGTVAGGGTTWSQVAIRNYTAAGIKTDGTLWTWGYNNAGQLGDGGTTSKRSPITTAGGGTNWKQVSCGNEHMAGIKTDGTLWTWGNNNVGQLGDGGTTSDRSSPGTTAGGGTTWSQVACGEYYTIAVKTDGTLWAWGYNLNGVLGDGTTTDRSSPRTVAGGGTTWKNVQAFGTAAALAIQSYQVALT